MITAERVREIHDEAGLFAFLRDELRWPLEETPDTFPFFADELDLTPDERRLIESVTQISNFETGQPFGIFLVKFRSETVNRSALRRVLRGLSETRKNRDAGLPAWKADSLMFLCTSNWQDYTVARYKGETHTRAVLSAFGWEREGDAGLRTLCDYNLKALIYPEDSKDTETWQKKWTSAFDVEAVTARFYAAYKGIFDQVETMIAEVQGDKRLFVQCLFNRLMFIHFLSKKGWLKFNGRTDYLAALWEGRNQDRNFYENHILHVFFMGLNKPHINRDNFLLTTHVGEVPYLNGGLFEQGKCDDKGEQIENKAFELIIGGLFEWFNFTVQESTPLDVEVAVDPEMLGKVFEELVTGRHESGSYYTPRPVVAFMCRESLKAYLYRVCPGEHSVQIEAFVDDYDATGLRYPEGVLDALRQVKACDPACGSGAYLLGLMQELLALRQALFASNVKDYAAVYDRKLEIIQRNLYGADKDEFAVSIAMLRLWLSLVIDDPRDPLESPKTDVSLPNLKFKIVIGDSLTSTPPDGLKLEAEQYAADATVLRRLYDEYFAAHERTNGKASRPKTEIEKDIEKQQAVIADLLGTEPQKGRTEWLIQFAEVFAPQFPTATLGGAMNFGQELVEPPLPGGFDIVLANPPYVRQEDIGAVKPLLERLYPDAAVGQSDLYCYFYARGVQLLRPGGIHIFVCSNSWLDVAYGGKLQEYLLKRAYVQSIYESAIERQFASADINTIISIIQKNKATETAQTRFISLLAPFDKAHSDPTQRREIVRTQAELWQAGLGDADKQGIQHYEGDKWGGKYLRAPSIYWKILEKAQKRLTALGNLANVRRGFTTGANDFFYVRVLGVKNGIATIRCDDGTEHTLEVECVQEPVLVKAREVLRPVLEPDDLAYRLVRLTEADASKPHAAAYIAWGEAQGFHSRQTTKSRKPWYSIRIQDCAAVAFPMAHKRRAVIVALHQFAIHIDNRFYGVYPHDNTPTRNLAVAASLLSTFSTLCREIHGRANFGQGMLDMKVYEVASLPTLNPALIDDIAPLIKAFDGLGNRNIQMIYDEVRRPDRHILDNAFLLAIGFDDAQERSEVLAELDDATCRQIWRRQAKAEGTREARQSYDNWLASGLPFGNNDEE